MNKNGLSRNIPEDVKRTIRQQANFGCVICGNAIGTYEHIEPPYHSATSHDPDKMTYLCCGCHDKVTRGRWSKDKVWDAKRKPFCNDENPCSEAFDVSSGKPEVVLGGCLFTNLTSTDGLQINGEKVLSFLPPEKSGGPFRLSAKFYDRSGNVSMEIIENEWFGLSSNWDIKCIGRKISIFDNQHKLSLELETVPPRGIILHSLNMLYGGCKVVAQDGILSLIGYNEKTGKEGLTLHLDPNGSRMTLPKGIVFLPTGAIPIVVAVNEKDEL